MLKKFFVFFFVLVLTGCTYLKSSAENNDNKNKTFVTEGGDKISHGNFSFVLPYDAKDTYSIEKLDNWVMVSEKTSAKSGSGGFAFGLKAFKNPRDYENTEDTKKLGELTDKSGVVYDIVLMKPSEIRYGDGENVEENYNRLYEYAENVEITGINGSTYVKGKGAKGEYLYNEVLAKHISAIKNNWNYSDYLNHGYSLRYPLLAKKDLLKYVGYVYYDMNSDGIDELIIGEIAKGKNKGTIFEVYTMEDREPMRVLTTDSGARYFVCSNSYFCVDDKTSKNQNILKVLYFKRNRANLLLQAQYMFDDKKDKENPWFVNYKFLENSWQPISKQEYDNARKLYSDYKRFDFIPLETVK